MLIATLFIIAKTWKQTRCLSASEWINCDKFTKWNTIQYKNKWAKPNHKKTWSCLKWIVCVCVCVCMCVCVVVQSCVTLHDPMDYSPTGSSVHGILPFPFPRDLPNPHCRQNLLTQHRSPKCILLTEKSQHFRYI